MADPELCDKSRLCFVDWSLYFVLCVLSYCSFLLLHVIVPFAPLVVHVSSGDTLSFIFFFGKRNKSESYFNERGAFALCKDTKKVW